MSLDPPNDANGFDLAAAAEKAEAHRKGIARINDHVALARRHHGDDVMGGIADVILAAVLLLRQNGHGRGMLDILATSAWERTEEAQGSVH